MFVLSFSLVVVWWTIWSGYNEWLRRTRRLAHFHSGVYDGITIGFAVFSVALCFLGLMPYTAAQLAISLFRVVAGAVAGTAIWALHVCILAFAHRRRGSIPDRVNRYPISWPWMLPLTGAAEEVLFRGCLLFGMVIGSTPRVLAVVISSLLFGVIHLFQQGISGMITHSLIGIMLAIIALEVGLSAALLCHGTHNLLAVAVPPPRTPLRRPSLGHTLRQSWLR